MSSEPTVEVSGLSPTTTDAALESFFSFCGKVQSVQRTEKSASIVFEKASAAKTSLMLDGGTLDGATIHVTSPHAAAATSGTASPVVTQEGGELAQEDKPRTAVVAEYLAHGYVLGDATIAKAIELDQRHGISDRFLTFFKGIDDKYAVSQRTNQASEQVSAKASEVSAQFKTKSAELDTQTSASTRLADLDAKTGASKHFSNAWEIGRSYYSRALASPQSAKVRDFYTSTAKQIHDVHAEAHRLAEEKAGHPIQGFSSRRGSSAAATGAPSASVVDPTGTTVPSTAATTQAAPVSTAPNVSTTPAPTGVVPGGPQ